MTQARKISGAIQELLAAPQSAMLVVPAPHLPNQRDNLVVQKLATAALNSLEVDQFAALLAKRGGQAGESELRAVRVGLIKVYLDAARLRLTAKATTTQLMPAKAAMRLLFEAADRLDQVKPAAWRGLEGVFGGPADDTKGHDELNEFARSCWNARIQITSVAMNLGSLISSESTKASEKGERRKRLRTLVDELAGWWKIATGKSIAPYVKAKRLDHGRAFVVGRSGAFLELSKTLFCKLDDFDESEVISCVTNVYEAQLAARKLKKRRQ